MEVVRLQAGTETAVLMCCLYQSLASPALLSTPTSVCNTGPHIIVTDVLILRLG